MATKIKKTAKKSKRKAKKKLRKTWLSDYLKILKKLRRKKVWLKRSYVSHQKKISLRIIIRERG